jgi:NAD(P)-dependent dehydrogenase (short-subunit alcohol dehydrogenase family)
MKHVVITGVSTGIGFATAAELLRRGYHVFGTVRKAADAERLQMQFGEMFTPLLFDVTDGPAIGTAVEEVQDALGEGGLYALINNAGIVIPGPLQLTPLEDFRAQFEVNLFGLLDVTQQFLPLLGARKHAPHPPGRVINISSVSGKIAYPFMGAYAATKHALEALSDSLRRELMLYDVDVIVIEPGTTRTPIEDKYKEQIQYYAQSDYGSLFAGLEKQLAEREQSGLPVEKVVDAICKALESEHPKSRYAVPRKRLTSWLIPRWLPDRWLDRLTANRLGLAR